VQVTKPPREISDFHDLHDIAADSLDAFGLEFAVVTRVWCRSWDGTRGWWGVGVLSAHGVRWPELAVVAKEPTP
jgi:hypothetical protein